MLMTAFNMECFILLQWILIVNALKNIDEPTTTIQFINIIKPCAIFISILKEI